MGVPSLGSVGKDRKELPGVESEEAGHKLLEDFVRMAAAS